MQLTILSHGSIGFLPGVPKSMLTPLLPGASALYADEFFGYVVIQEVITPHGVITHYTCQAKKDITIRVVSEENWLGVLVVLQNHITYASQDQGSSLKQGRFQFYNIQSVDCDFIFKKENTYRLLTIALPQSFIPFLPNDHPVTYCTIPALDAVDQLLAEPFNHKQTIILLEQLLQIVQQNQVHKKLSVKKIENAWLVRELIRNDIQNHFTIAAISKQTGINEHGLKENFRQVFGMGMHEYLKYERMKLAEQLVKETDLPLKLIAERVGFISYDAFITAFKMRFRTTPGLLRKKLLAFLLWPGWDDLFPPEIEFLFS